MARRKKRKMRDSTVAATVSKAQYEAVEEEEDDALFDEEEDADEGEEENGIFDEDDDEDDDDNGDEEEEEEDDDEDDDDNGDEEDDEEDDDDNGEALDGDEEDEEGNEEDEVKQAASSSSDDDEEEDDEDVDYPYYVQEEAVDGEGVLRKPGDVVVVKCRNCALWKREWAGKVRCDTGNIVNEEEECHPDKFSCGAYFWPFDKAYLLDEFLNMDPAKILLINRMKVGLRRLLGSPSGSHRGAISHLEWISEWLKRHQQDETVDPVECHDDALSYVKKFSSFEEVDFLYEFFGVYADKVKKQEKANRRLAGKPRGFRRGDLVEWTNLSDGSRLNGLVMRIGGRDFKGQIRVACITQDHPFHGAQCEFMVDEWKRKCSPKVKVEAKEPERIL